MVFDILKDQSQEKFVPVKRGIFVGKLEDTMEDALVRLLNSLERPLNNLVLLEARLKELRRSWHECCFFSMSPLQFQKQLRLQEGVMRLGTRVFTI
jgi:hypothetical protein